MQLNGDWLLKEGFGGREIRGGLWERRPLYAATGNRFWDTPPAQCFYLLGLRICRSVR